MNQHKLQKLLKSPQREGFLQRHKTKESGTCFWDYVDKKCIYHNREYGGYYSFAEKIFEKYIGSPSNIPLYKLRNNPKYHKNYFFKNAVDSVYERLIDNYRYGSPYYDFYIDKKTNILTAIPLKPKRIRQEAECTYWTYTYSKKTVEVRKGIHYWVLAFSHYKTSWSKELKMEVGQDVPAVYKQINSKELQYYELENKFIEP